MNVAWFAELCELSYMKKPTGNSGFADMAISHRKVNNRFFQQMDTLLDWKAIERTINRYDKRGQGIAGNLAYPGLVLFKMSLLGIWYDLSDRALEERVNDSISFSRFCGLSLEDPVPDHSIVSRFRTMLTYEGAWDQLLAEVNRQLESHKLLVKTGVLVDASITSTPRKPKGKAVLEPEEPENDAPETGETELRFQRVYKPGVDLEASWTKKAGKIHYGYKKHHATDTNGLVLAVETTAANAHDLTAFEKLVFDSSPPKRSRIYADKGYFGKKQRELLPTMKLKSGIQDRAVRGRKLTRRQIERNKLISKVRYAVERTFGSQKRWFGAGATRYVGLARTHTQHVLEAICYNLKRAPMLYTIKLANA